MGVSTYIGSLYEDLASVAWRVHHLPEMPSLVVWVDERAEVYAAASDSAPDITADKLIGTYGPGRTLEAIEDDLRAMLRERARGAIADPSA